MLAGKTCYGLDLRDTTLEYGFDLGPLITLYQRSSRKKPFFNDFFARLAGTPNLRKQIEQGYTQEQISDICNGAI